MPFTNNDDPEFTPDALSLSRDPMPKFCSMEITQQVRDHAAKLAEKDTLSSSEAVEQARKQGMEEMSAEE